MISRDSLHEAAAAGAQHRLARLHAWALLGLQEEVAHVATS